MSSEQDLSEVTGIFSEAVAKVSLVERERYLAAACAQRPELRRQVDSLLCAHSQAGEFLSQNVLASNRPGMGEKPGDVIDRYKLLQEIGEGGFGLVFMAEQQEPVHRMVALKIIKAGMDTRDVVARFEAERQALALMDHPNIARVLDGGATVSGRPYFVMDLVKGVPITDFCDRNQLSIPARLELFLQVCSGVQHAHQKGLIHRDLKPTNVLVTVSGGEPIPKIIDFGIAKAIGHKLTERTVFTRFEELIGTPAYMSPEQAEWGGADIDTRSDIYSLGALLYELMTGTTPFEKATLVRAALDEVRRMIRETDPQKPSLRLQGLGQRLKEIAQQRQVEPSTLPRLVRGELDWILTKCLEKNRARRYATAHELAQDLQRHLRGEVVLARPPSRLYQFRKTVRKHKLAISAGSLVLGALVAGLALSNWMFLKARRAEHEQARLRQLADNRQQIAVAEAAKKQELASLLTDMLKGAAPEVARGRDISILREILDKATARVLQFTNQPEVQVDALGTLVDVYDELQLYGPMEAMARGRTAIAKARFGENSLVFADALGSLGVALRRSGQWEQSEAYLRKAVALAGEGATAPRLRQRLADTLMSRGKLDEAESLFRELLVIRPQTPVDRAVLLNNLALVLKWKGQPAEGEKLQRESVELSRKSSPESLNTLAELQNLGAQSRAAQRLDEAETLYREALALSRKLWGKDDAKIIPTALSLVDLLAQQKKYDQAEQVFGELLNTTNERPPESASLLAARADFFARRGLWKEAVSDLCNAIKLRPGNSAQFATLATVLASAGQDSAYQLLDPQVRRSLPPMAFSLIASNSAAEAWQTVDDATPAAGLKGRACSMMGGQKGRLYCVGWMNDGSARRQAGVIRGSRDSGKSWTTLSSWMPTNWPIAVWQGACIDSDGRLFAGGDICDKLGNDATIDWCIWRSADDGATWTLQDLVDSGVGGKAQCRAVLAASPSEIYAAGLTATNQGAGGWVWLVRKSSDRGATWSTVDSIWDHSVKEARAIGAAPNGSIFVAGMLNSSLGVSSPSVWTVRRSSDAGKTWATVDSYQAASGLAAGAYGVAVDPRGAIYVTGMAEGRGESGGTLIGLWVVRRSADNGQTWSVVDELALGESSTGLAGPTGITIASSGAVWVCGYMVAIDHSLHWLVREGTTGPDGALSWRTVDNYQLVPGQSARPNAIMSGAEGDIYVTGRAADPAGADHWITRRFLRPGAVKTVLGKAPRGNF